MLQNQLSQRKNPIEFSWEVLFHRNVSILAFWSQDIKNADLALFELSRVITLEPNWPEVYEQRAEVRALSLLSHCTPLRYRLGWRSRGPSLKK